MKPIFCPLRAILVLLLGLCSITSAHADNAKDVPLYLFTGQGNGGADGKDGSAPAGGLIADASGNLYGTTSSGGSSGNCSNGCGTVFQLVPAPISGYPWTENILYNFQGGTDGWMPLANLTFDPAGNLYGTTAYGGTGTCKNYQGVAGCGTVFELPLVNGTYSTETILYSFQGPANDGAVPSAGVIFDSAGNLYGTTAYGGPNTRCGTGYISGCGTIFELSPQGNAAWAETVLWTFHLFYDGRVPVAPLVFGPDGSLYGTTENGGGTRPGCAPGCGTIFQLSPQPDGTWQERVVHRFVGSEEQGRDGALPEAGLVLFGNALYGTTTSGGIKGNGTVYEVSVTEKGPTETILYTAACGLSGPVVFDGSGDIYAAEGFTNYGGPTCSTVFRLHPPKPGDAWIYDLVTQLNNGGDPVGGLLLLGDTLYGVTNKGGVDFGNCSQNQGCGVAYSILPK